jgi:hypothetical protein
MLVNFVALFVYFTAVWSILWRVGIFCGHFSIFSTSGILHQVKSGNPA